MMRPCTGEGMAERGAAVAWQYGRVPRAVPASELSYGSIAFGHDGGVTDRAVERASVNVPAGQFVAIVDPTGCGKSTLLDVQAGVLSRSTGRVTVFGMPIVRLNDQAGYLFQAEALFP